MPREVAREPALGRLRPDAEPLSEQVARYRRATWGLTGVAGGVALMFVGLFGAFGRPLVGSVVALAISGPILAAAWLEVRALSRRASSYNDSRPSPPAPGGPGAGPPAECLARRPLTED